MKNERDYKKIGSIAILIISLIISVGTMIYTIMHGGAKPGIVMYIAIVLIGFQIYEYYKNKNVYLFISFVVILLAIIVSMISYFL